MICAPASATRRAASGNHWSQHTSVADPRVARGEARKAEVARREVELLVVQGIVRDVHLAVEPGDASVGLERDRRVVVEALGAPLEERRHDRDLARGRELAELLGRRAGNRLGEVEARRCPRSGRSSASGTAPAGTRCWRRAAPPPRCARAPSRRSAPGSSAQLICTSPIETASRRTCHAGVGTPRLPGSQPRARRDRPRHRRRPGSGLHARRRRLRA